MNYPWLEKYLLAKAGVTSDYKLEWGWQRYMVGGKLFAATMRPSGKYAPEYAEKELLNLKCDPMFSQLLQAEYGEVLPGFYSDKRCWISVDLGGKLPDELMKKLIDDSYGLVFGKLTKKLRQEISERAD